MGGLHGHYTTGAWGTTEWVPILVKSSVALGMLPDLDGVSGFVAMIHVLAKCYSIQVVSWIPMDTVANAVKELVLSEQRPPKLVNVVHPHPVPFRTVIDGFQASLGQSIKIVAFEEWISVVEDIAEQGKAEDLDRVVCSLLLRFYL